MLVPATINLSWISNYVGPHRVCYRVVGDPTYTCTVPGTPGPGFHPVCAGGGAPCSYQIDIMVDNETCDQVDYECYVQPACEDEDSLIGRIPFNISFIPDPACKRWEVVCDHSPVVSASVTAPGAGYTPGTFAVPLVGGGGTGATAEAVVGNGEVISYVEDDLGTGYNNGTYLACPMTNVAASGAGLQMDITVAGGLVTVDAIAAAGSGYVDGDTVKPDEATVGVPGVIETITLTVDDVGAVVAVNITANGSDYTSEPVVDLSGLAGGAGAAAETALTGCTALEIYDCDGASGEILPLGTFQPTDVYGMCGEVAPTIPADYSVSQVNNCLCDCVLQDIENTDAGGTIDYTYIACDGSVVTGTLGGASALGDTCMVDGSLETVVNAPAVLLVTPNGDCDAVAP